MKTLLEDKVCIRNMEINFSIFYPDYKNSSKIMIATTVLSGSKKVLEHEEFFHKGCKKIPTKFRQIKAYFESKKPHYIFDVIYTIIQHENRTTQRIRN